MMGMARQSVANPHRIYGWLRTTSSNDMVRATMARPPWLLLLALLVAPGWASALGLGEIKLASGLNQRLSAEVRMFSLRPNDVDGMQIVLGSAEQFRRAGVERPFSLTKLRFKSEDFGDGTGMIRLTTQNAVAEPFLNFLIEVNWPTGRLVREFTLLLDPPVYGAAIRQTVARVVPTLQPPAPRALAPRTSSAVANNATSSVRPAASPFTQRVGPAPQAPPVRTQPAAVARMRNGAPPEGGGIYGPVRRNDTLWSLSSRLRPDSSVPVQQMMLAILRANPQAFIDGNVNALSVGVVLRVPTRSEVTSVRREQALAQIRQQNTDWQGARRSLAANVRQRASSTSAAQPQQGPTASTAATAAPTVAANVAAPDDLGKLRIDGAGAGNSIGAGDSGEFNKLGEQVGLAKEELLQSRSENDELQSKLDEAENIIVDMERLAQIHDDQLAQLQQQLAQTQQALEGALTDSSVAPAVIADTSTLTAETVASAAAKAAAALEEEPTEIEAKGTPLATTGEMGKEPAVSPASVEPTQADAVAKVPPTAVKAPVAPKTPIAPVAPVAIVTPPEDPKGLVDEIIAMAGGLDPTVLVGGGGFIIVMLGLLMYLRRKRAAGTADSSKLEEVMLDNASDTDPIEFTSPRTEALFDDADTPTIFDIGNHPTQKLSVQETIRTDQLQDDGPLEEANVYLAHERFDQAEEIVIKAIDERPDKAEYRVKLLEIYRGMHNRLAFDTTLASLSADFGSDHAAVAEGEAFARDFPVGGASDTGVDLDLGGGSGDILDGEVGFALSDDPVPAEPQVDREERTQDSDIDFDLGYIPAAEDAGQQNGASSVDFMLDTATPTLAGDVAGIRAVAGSDIDFYLGAKDNSDSAVDNSSSKTQMPDLDVFVDADDDSGRGVAAAEGVAAAAASSTGDLEFDLDFFGSEEETQDAAGVIAAGPEPVAEGAVLATGVAELDFDLDFDESASSDEIDSADTVTLQAVIPEAFETVELDLGPDTGYPFGDADSLAAIASQTVLGGPGHALDINFDDESGELVSAATDTMDSELVLGDGDDVLFDGGASGDPQDLIDTVSLGPTTVVGETGTDLSDGLFDLGADLDLALPESPEEETADRSLGLTGLAPEDDNDITSLDLDAGDADDELSFDLDAGYELDISPDFDEADDELSIKLETLTGDNDINLAVDFGSRGHGGGLDDNGSDIGELLFDLDGDIDDAVVGTDDDDIVLDTPEDAASGSFGELTVQVLGDLEDNSFADYIDFDLDGLGDDVDLELPMSNASDIVLLTLGDDDTADIALDLLLEETADTSELTVEPGAPDLSEIAFELPGTVSLEDSADDLSLDLGIGEGASLTVGLGDRDFDIDDALTFGTNDDETDLQLLSLSDGVLGASEDSAAFTGSAAFDLGLNDDLGRGQELFEDEFTVDLQTDESGVLTMMSGADAPAALESNDEISFDLELDDGTGAEISFDLGNEDVKLPPETRETQSFLGTIDNGDEVIEEMPAVVLDISHGLAVETADLDAGISELRDPFGSDTSDGMGLDFALLAGASDTNAVGGSETVVRDEPPACPRDGDAPDFDLSDFDPLAAAQTDSSSVEQADDDRRSPTLGLGTIDDEDEDETLTLSSALLREVDAVQTKLELAEEFIQLGDLDSARDALDDIVAEGSEAQIQAARALLERI